MLTLNNNIYVTGDELLDDDTQSIKDISKLCAFEKLRYKIVLSKKSVLSREEVMMYARLCLADRDTEIPYSLIIDLNSWRKKDDAEAIYLSGLFYLNGIKPFEKDDKKAFGCFKDAYEKGFKKASINLGECYFKGIGCEKDYSKSKEMLLLNLDNRKCLAYLGFIYINEGDEEGWKLLTKSNGMEEKESFYYLGLAYQDARFKHQDRDKALLFFRVGSDLGEEKCHFLAGKLCFESEDPFLKSLSKIYLERDKNNQEAKNLLSIIAETDDSQFINIDNLPYKNIDEEENTPYNPFHSNNDSQKVGLHLLKKIAETDDETDMKLYHFYIENNEKSIALYHLKRAFYRGNLEAKEIYSHLNLTDETKNNKVD